MSWKNIASRPPVYPTEAVARRVEQAAELVELGDADTGRDAGLRAQLGQAGRAYESSMRNHDDVVGDLLHLTEHMARHEDRAALVGEPAKVAAQPSDPLWVQPVRRLVEYQHRRVTKHRRGEAESLPHAQGERPDPAVSIRGQVHLGQDAGRCIGWKLGGDRQCAQVVHRAAARVEAGRLEQRPDFADGIHELVIASSSCRRRSGRGTR